MKAKRNWIFLRGLGRHAGHWGPFLRLFKSTFPEDQIEFLDLRGNGSLAHSRSWTSIRENVRDLRARSQFLQNGEPVHLFSLSLGAMCAVEWAEKYPEEIEALVTINTSDRGTSNPAERMRPANLVNVLKVFEKNFSAALNEGALLELTSQYFHQNQLPVPPFADYRGTSRLNFLRQLIAAGTYEFPKRKPRTEILILCSDGDQLVNSQCSKRIAAMWTLKPFVHPQAGHDLTLEDPQWVCDQLKNWPVLGS